MKIPFTHSDIVLLATLGACSGWRGASLTSILYNSDYLNRNPFTPQELRRGMAKLTAADYVRQKRERYKLTPEGRRIVAWKGSKSHIGHFCEMVQRLDSQMVPTNAVDPDPWFEDENWPYPDISDEKVVRAAEQYSRNLADSYRDHISYTGV